MHEVALYWLSPYHLNFYCCGGGVFFFFLFFFVYFCGSERLGRAFHRHPAPEYEVPVDLSSVQFNMVSVRSEKPICAPPCLSEVSPTLPLKLARMFTANLPSTRIVKNFTFDIPLNVSTIDDDVELNVLGLTY